MGPTYPDPCHRNKRAGTEKGTMVEMKLYSISTKVISWKADLEKTRLVAPTMVAHSTMVAPMLSNKDVIDTSVLLKNIGFSLVAAKRTIDSIPLKMLIGKRMILQYN